MNEKWTDNRQVSGNTDKSGLQQQAEEDRNVLIEQFVGKRADYYRGQFEKIGNKTRFTWTFNRIAALLGPIWFGSYGIWKWALPFTMLEAFALAQISRGLWGNLAATVTDRIETIGVQLELRRGQLQAAIESNSDKVDAYRRNIEGLEHIIEQAKIEFQQIEASRSSIIIFGVVLLIVVKLAQGVLANSSLERRFSDWVSDRSIMPGMTPLRMILSVFFVLLIYIANMIHIGSPETFSVLDKFPTRPSARLISIGWIEAVFNFLNLYGERVFDSISYCIKVVLDFLEAIFVQTSWVVIAAFIIVLSALSAGPRAAIYCTAFLSFMGLVGLWTLSMQTLALLGTAACISIGFGIPLGIFCARFPKVYAVIKPIMDFQQTMPAFVYMIPIIAFFGAGKPAAVITCMIFGMPPVVRLTVLGIQGVPDTIREAAIAYGASNWYLMTRVELPLAAPSIRAGINQTILLSLLTVVVASLIGAKGLGEDVLEALQYASVGQGLLAGFAILFLAMILDRIIQGKHKGV